MKVSVTSLERSACEIIRWTNENVGRYVCVSNVHMCMESFDDSTFLKLVNEADLVVPDGKPLVWAQKLLGVKNARQVRGMDLTLSLCAHTAKLGIPIGFYGGSQSILNKLQEELKLRYPQIMIGCAISPPFRPLSENEDNEYVTKIKDSGVKILFVGIGCPKQEKWMAEHKLKINCTMLGVGAAFDFISGEKRYAPHWIQVAGFEWLFRMLCEPRRLWKRYMKQNPRFLWYFGKQLLNYYWRKIRSSYRQ